MYANSPIKDAEESEKISAEKSTKDKKERLVPKPPMSKGPPTHKSEVKAKGKADNKFSMDEMVKM